MKVTLTQVELETMVRESLGIPSFRALTVEISNPENYEDSVYLKAALTFDAVSEEVSNRKKVNAVKIVRQHFGLSLRYAKQAIDDIFDMHQVTLGDYLRALESALADDVGYNAIR